MQVSVNSSTTNNAQTTALQKRRVRLNWADQLTAYLFLLPAIIVFLLFAWLPIVRTVIFSFQKVSLNSDSTWVGFDNFHRMLIDPAFGVAWANSFIFATLSLLMGFLIPVFVAIMINEMRRARAFFRLVYFLPTVIPITVAILIFRLLFSSDSGFLNALIVSLGGKAQLWLQSPQLVKPSIIILLTWANFGTTLLIYIAALQDIPAEQYEVAEIDGASPFQRIYYITLPYLIPTMVITFVLQIIFVVQIFTEPFLLTNGGPGTSTLTPVLVIYRKAFLNNDFGLASAWSMSLIIILSIFSVIYLRISNRVNSKD